MKKRKLHSKILTNEEKLQLQSEGKNCDQLPGYFSRVKRLKRYGKEANDIFENATKCDLCGETDRKFTIDHNHDSGAFRGILCYKCNVGLGLFNESEERFLKAIAYLKGRG